MRSSPTFSTRSRVAATKTPPDLPPAGFIRTREDLRSGIAALARSEAVFGRVYRELGLPGLRRRRPTFDCLVHIVVDQMISIDAARAIRTRLLSAIKPFDAETIARLSPELLLGLGLSRAKAGTIGLLARAIATGELDLSRLTRLSDADVRSALTMHKGIGPWTAEIFMLTALGRSDAWPAGDVALQTAVQDLFGLPRRPGFSEMHDIAGAWQPWRAVAARLLWLHYRRMRGLPLRAQA